MHEYDWKLILCPQTMNLKLREYSDSHIIVRLEVDNACEIKLLNKPNITHMNFLEALYLLGN
jgi:hypothetical protein